MKRISFLVCLIASLWLCSCNRDPEPPIYDSVDTIGKGVLVLNEGTYMYANSTLSFYDPVEDTVANNLFYRVNGSPIGDVGQSLALMDGKLYIVVNNSNCIYKVDARTLVCDTLRPYMLTDFYSPRYMLPVSPDKAYISDLAGAVLWIVNPQDMTHSGSISLGKPTETMVQVGNEVYVTNWSRYYFPVIENNTVQVVDINNDVKVAEITVGMEPNGMVVDKNGMVWVLCEGDVNDEEVPSTLWRIDPRTKKSTLVRTFDKKALNLAVDPSGRYLYYVYGGDWTASGDVCRASIDNPAEEDGFRIPAEGRMFYKLFVDPANGDIYVSDAKTYTVSGTVYRYTSDGLLLSSFGVGICPGFMLFN